MHGQINPDVATHGAFEGDPRRLLDGEPRKLLSVDMVSHVLGGITRREVYKRLDAGDMESVWIGRRRLVTAASVDAYVQRLRREAHQRGRSDPPPDGAQPPDRPPRQPDRPGHPENPPRKLRSVA